MNNDQYKQTQFQLLELAREISTLDLDSFRARISAAQLIAPAIDPTLYREAHVRLEAIDHLAAAAVGLRKAYNELQSLALAELAARTEARE